MKVRLTIDRVQLLDTPLSAEARREFAAALQAALMETLDAQARAGVPAQGWHAAHATLRLPPYDGSATALGTNVAGLVARHLWAAPAPAGRATR